MTVKIKNLLNAKKLQQIISWKTDLLPFDEEQKVNSFFAPRRTEESNIINSFIWEDTKEGVLYWREINSLLRSSYKEENIDVLWKKIKEERFQKLLTKALE